MSIMIFTAEEANIIAIYKADTLAATIAGIDEALTDLLDEDIITIAESASRKLFTLTEPEFSTIIFTPADETEAEPDEGGEHAEIIQESAD